MIELLKTGIKGLDKILGGGLPRDSITTISGPTGAGKSIFGMDYLVKGAEKGEVGLYITIEQSKDELIKHMSSFSWDLDKLERERRIVFLDYPPHEVDQLFSRMNPVKELVTTFNVERVVIDSIMPVAIHFNNELERRRGFLRLIENIKKWQTTTFIISEDTPATTQDVLPSTKYGIESLTDGWIHLYYLWAEGRRQRALEVIKMRGVKHECRLVPFEITKTGIVVKP